MKLQVKGKEIKTRKIELWQIKDLKQIVEEGKKAYKK